MAGIGVADIGFFDFYSCFPIAVANVADALGLAPDDPRKLSVTGGLPYFGGAGNNYSMHAIATMVDRLRQAPGNYGLVGANGGVLSKYSAAVYSTRPAPWQPSLNHAIAAELELVPDEPLTENAEGWATIVSYTIGYDNGQPKFGVILGRTGDGRRFFALTPEGDEQTLAELQHDEVIGRRILVRALGYGNRFAFDPALLARLYPRKPLTLRSEYEFVRVERRGHLLEISINRPEAGNALHPPANEELDQIFGAYFADPDLWVAIITGEGSEAFCTGMDLKYKPDWRGLYAPVTGFAGLTHRTRRDKPVIAAVNGFAMGGGFETVLACDLVVADAGARFALSEVKVGLIAGMGGISRLVEQVPQKIALEAILTGRRIDVEEARLLGLVNRVAAKGEALAAARELAVELVANSPTAIRLSLRYLRDAEQHASVEASLCNPTTALDDLMMSEDMVEGIRAFAEKRPPRWTGR
jgi:acetyl-CoA C-acetyltransferase